MQTKMTMPTRRAHATARRRKTRWRQTLTAYAFVLPYVLAFLLFQLVPFLTGIALELLQVGAAAKERASSSAWRISSKSSPTICFGRVFSTRSISPC